MMSDKDFPILGIGNDIIEIERIRTSFAEHGQHMLSKLLTEKEQAYCLHHKDPVPHLAGRFSAKEAIVKALGTGFGAEVGWLDIEIVNEPSGKPSVHFSEKLRSRYSGTRVLVSISHCQQYASSYALWVRLYSNN